jgi:hypothetical protein
MKKLVSLLAIGLIATGAFADEVATGENQQVANQQPAFVDIEQTEVEKVKVKLAQKKVTEQQTTEALNIVIDNLNNTVISVAQWKALVKSAAAWSNNPDKLVDVLQVLEQIVTLVDQTIAMDKEKDPEFAKKLKEALSKLDLDSLQRVNTYLFGKKRETIALSQLPNEGFGILDLGGGRKVRFSTEGYLNNIAVPGVKYVVAVERVPDGNYRVGVGDFVRGEEKVVIEWGKYPYKSPVGVLDYYNIKKGSRDFNCVVYGGDQCNPRKYSSSPSATDIKPHVYKGIVFKSIPINKVLNVKVVNKKPIPVQVKKGDK